MQRKVRMVFGNMTSESLQVFMETTKAIRKLSKYKIIVDEFDNIDLLVDKLFGDALQ